MANFETDKLAAQAAEAIVVAAMPSIRFPIDRDGGKAVADFYSEIFNGIAETLGKS